MCVLGGFDTAHAAARLDFDSNLQLSCVVVYEFVSGGNINVSFLIMYRAYDRAAIKFRGVDADINFNLSDYDEDLKQVIDWFHFWHS